MTINELQKELQHYKIHVLVEFHFYENVLNPIKHYGKYDLVIKSTQIKDSLGSHILGFISSISSAYATTNYDFRYKPEVQKIIFQFVKTPVNKRKYNTYKSSKGYKFTQLGRKRLASSTKLVQQTKFDPWFKNDLENYGQDAWNILATDDNFDDYYNFKLPKNKKPKHNKTITLKLSPREQVYLKWLKEHAKNNNDEDFKGNQTSLLHYLLNQDQTIDWHKYHLVMERFANLTLKENGQLADLKKQLHEINKK